MEGYDIDVTPHVGAAAIAEIEALVALVTRHDGHPPLDERLLLDLRGGGRRGFAAIAARAGPTGALVGYAQLTVQAGGWGLAVVLHPDHRANAGTLQRALLGTAIAEARRQGGGRLHYWARGALERDAVDARALGFEVERDLNELRVALPLSLDVTDTTAPPVAGLVLRAFVAGRDEQAWLRVNNRAFADHPEQGGWALSTLLEREQLTWFDPDGLLLAEVDGVLAGSCWTKLHHEHGRLVGEIYVIGVDPDFHHRGLGRVLTIAGLDHLAEAGADTAMLFVDASNAAAMALYESLGFDLHRVDRAYRLDVAGPG